jgi:hypothetical protein
VFFIISKEGKKKTCTEERREDTGLEDSELRGKLNPADKATRYISGLNSQLQYYCDYVESRAAEAGAAEASHTH